MKKVKCFLTILICLLLCSCRWQGEYNFLNATSEICEIAIVDIALDENNELTQTEVCRVEDIDAFLREFQEIKCFIYFGDPVSALRTSTQSATVIKVSYSNGEYELINWSGQSYYTLDNGFKFYAGYRVFDEQQFANFINLRRF